MLDTSIIKIYDIVDKRFISLYNKLIFFSINTMACLCLQFMIINYLRIAFKVKGTKEIFSFSLIFKLSFISLSVSRWIIGIFDLRAGFLQLL